MAVPNIFANVTTTIPLSQLDTNFATAITLGNTAVYLGNTTTALGNLTLNNVTIASGTASGNLSTGNVTVSGTLGVTGATTLSSTLAAGNTTITGTLSATGNVGIGATAGGSKLGITGTTGGTNPYITFNSAFVTASYFGVATQANDIITGDALGDLVLDAGSNFLLTTNGNNLRLKVDTSGLFAVTGTFKVSTGAAVGGATAGAGGLAFPATAVAVANANTLDDYEEGTWTPSLGGTATYSDRAGQYTKIGRMVYLWGSITVNLIGTGSVNTMSGLPFTDYGGGTGVPSYFGNLTYPVTRIVLFTNNTDIRNGASASSETTATVDLNIYQNGSRIDFSLTYQTNA